MFDPTLAFDPVFEIVILVEFSSILRRPIRDVLKRRHANLVELFENHIDVLLSVHKQCSPKANWEDLLAAEGPPKPVFEPSSEREARARFESYEPQVIDKLLRRGEKRRQELAQALGLGFSLQTR